VSLVFICGPHGAGKTTLLDRLQATNKDIMVPTLVTASVKLHTTPADRIVLKTCLRAVENYEALQLANGQPDKITIGNRCIYDTLAYMNVYRKRGWITESEYSRIFNVTAQVFPEGLQEPQAIVLNPPFETVWSRLQGRWQKGEKKWQEDDSEYCRLACQEYRNFKGNANVLYLSDNAVVPELLEWLDVHRLEVV